LIQFGPGPLDPSDGPRPRDFSPADRGEPRPFPPL
jgi:hypothetical protein